MNPTFLLFLVLLLANSLLSYAPLSSGWRLGIFLVGLLLPLLWAWKERILGTTELKEEIQRVPGIGPWAFLLLGILAVGARFGQLTTLFVWPNFDESSIGFDSFHLASGWPIRFFYGISQAPPLFMWMLALWFKLLGCSLVTLRAFPALVSLTAVPLSYGAARTLFPRPQAFLAAALVGIGFWPVFIGRFTLMTNWVLPFECMALWALGSFFRSKDAAQRLRAALGLGCLWGLGLYTHLHWPIVVAVTSLPFAVRLWDRRKDPSFGSVHVASLALVSAMAVAAPLLGEAIREHYGAYLGHLWAFHRDFSWTHQFNVWLSCFTAPFWGIDPEVHTYQPVWGGFLNPLLSSLFFLGLLSLLRRNAPPLYHWVLASLGLCLLPGLLTQDQETFRLFPMVPFLILGILLGWGSLQGAVRSEHRWILLAVLAAGSILLDYHHLFGVYHRVWDDPKTWGSYTKSFGRYRAYGILEERIKKEGPGLIFPDFVQGLPDQSLAVATFDHNAVLNPGLDPAQARWAAILTNVNYETFLKKRFPRGMAYALTRDLPSEDGGWMLFVFPTLGVPNGTLALWVRAQKDLETFLDQHLCFVMGGSMSGDIGALEKLEPFFRGDPYLRASYWEKMADLQVKSGPAGWGEAIQDLRRATHEGWPAAHLYERSGVLHLLRGERDLARKDLEAARRCPLDLTDSQRLLGTLRIPRK